MLNKQKNIFVQKKKNGNLIINQNGYAYRIWIPKPCVSYKFVCINCIHKNAKLCRNRYIPSHTSERHTYATYSHVLWKINEKQTRMSLFLSTHLTLSYVAYA